MLWETLHYMIINDIAVLRLESQPRASAVYLAEVMTGEMQFHIDTKERVANRPQGSADVLLPQAMVRSRSPHPLSAFHTVNHQKH